MATRKKTSPRKTSSKRASLKTGRRKTSPSASKIRAVSDRAESEFGFPMGADCDSSYWLGLEASMHGQALFGGSA